MRRLISTLAVCAALSTSLLPLAASAAEPMVDTDTDGLSDTDELVRYHTDPWRADSDGDEHTDGQEVSEGFSPRHLGKKLDEVDSDSDGLNDLMELVLGSDLMNRDTDGDSYPDGDEVRHGYSPTIPEPVQVRKRIEITLKTQRLAYYFGDAKLGEFKVSTGKRSTPTPVGEFKVQWKHPRAWSSSAKLYMPWWMSLGRGYGIHELPEWPGGAKEGANHLGIPVSHGCIRLGVGPAKTLYDWAPEGTQVVIKKE